VWIVYKKVNRMEVRILKNLEETRGRRPWLSRHGRIVPTFNNNYSISVLFVNRLLVSGLFVVE
jgi:hypothetical protein